MLYHYEIISEDVTSDIQQTSFLNHSFKLELLLKLYYFKFNQGESQ